MAEELRENKNERSMNTSHVVASMIAWLKRLRRDMRLRSDHRLKVRTGLQSSRDIQLNEFDDSVFICLNGIPLIHAELLKYDIVEALHDVRENYQRYLMREKMSEEQKYYELSISTEKQY